MNNTDVHTSIPKAEASTMRGTTDERDNRDNRDNLPTASLAFFSPSEKASRISALTSSGTLVVRLELLQPSARGRLGEVIDEGIERELHARGAAGPGVGPQCERSATLGDQLFRARRVGATRIAVLLGPLRAILGPEGALEVEDSATLRFLAASTRLSPVLLWLDDGDGLTGAYVDPVPLAQLFNLAVPTPRRTNDARNGGNGMAPKGPSSERRPRLGTATWSASEPAAKSSDAGTVQRAAMAQLFSDTDDDAETDPFKAELADAEAPLPAPPSPPSRPSPTSRPSSPTSHPSSPTSHPSLTSAAPSEPAAPKVQAAILAESKAPPPDAWRAWTHQLAAVRGPQPLATFGKLFAESYLPLANALATGLKDAKAIAAHDEFRRTFERAYVEACPTFAVTGKRPKLVLDLPDIAARNARLHGARSVHLLMVDSMRFDLGSLVKTALQRALEGRATLTEETLLWSALPSTTTRQLEGLARGLDSLRTPPALEREGDSLRGRTAEIVRRIRAGSRDLFKLDIVEARLREAPNKAISSLPDIALATATVLARHCDHLPPRTLLVVFGDHGFTTDEHGNAVHGGASPEEVLVPAYMFLMGEVH